MTEPIVIHGMPLEHFEETARIAGALSRQNAEALIAEIRRLRAEGPGGVHMHGYYYRFEVDGQAFTLGFQTHAELLGWVEKYAEARGPKP